MLSLITQNRHQDSTSFLPFMAKGAVGRGNFSSFFVFFFFFFFFFFFLWGGGGGWLCFCYIFLL
jgi:hypothetical protein